MLLSLAPIAVGNFKLRSARQDPDHDGGNWPSQLLPTSRAPQGPISLRDTVYEFSALAVLYGVSQEKEEH